MKRYQSSQGLTLAEILVIIVIIGILAAIAAPNFQGLISRVKLSQAVTEVRGALQESQRQAIRTSQACRVTLNIADRKVTGPCMITGDRTLPNGVAMATNVSSSPGTTGNPSRITFGILGSAEFTVTSSVATPTDPSGKIVLYMSNNSIPDQRCVAVSNTLGLSRVGTYSGPMSAADITNSGVCTAS